MKRVSLAAPRKAVHTTSYVRDQGTADNPRDKHRGVAPPKGGTTTPLIIESTPTKNKIDVHSLMALADELSAGDRKELLAKLALQSQSGGRAARSGDVDMWASAVYEGLVKALQGNAESLSGPVLVKRALGTSAVFGPVAEFMAASKLQTLTVTERHAVYRALAQLVIEEADRISKRSDIPLSAKLVGNCAANIAGIFDRAFPGYLRSGLAMVVARRLLAPIENF